MSNWYKQGYDGITTEESRISTLTGPGRLWIPPGERREFVFIDDAPAQIYEHNPKLNGSFRNWMTCLKGINEQGCPVCDQLGEKTRYYCGYFSVIDCSKWKDKKGNDHQFELNLLQAKLKTMKKFKRKKEDAIEAGRVGLAGSLFRATREDDKSPTCGDEFEFIREPDMSKLFELALYRGKKLSEMFDKAEENETSMTTLQKIFQVQFEPDSDGKKLIRKLVPFNYMSVLAPKEYKELKQLVAGAERDDDSRGGGGGKSEEDVPF